MLQRYAKLNCDYGKKLNITGCFKKLVIYLYQHSDTEEKKITQNKEPLHIRNYVLKSLKLYKTIKLFSSH